MARTRARDYDEKRQEILRQAGKLFAEHGYSGTSITMIAEACGVSRSLLYYYYAEKDAVLFDILLNNVQEQLAAAESAAKSVQDPKERLFEIILAMLEFSRNNEMPRLVRMKNIEALPDDKKKQHQDVERKLVAILSKSIAEAVPSVGQGPLLKAVTMSVFSMLNWLFRWYREGGGLTRRDYARLVTQMVLSGAPVAALELPEPAVVKRQAKAK